MSTDGVLRQRAADLRSRAQNDQDRCAADMLDQLAEGPEGRRLRAWLDKQQRDRMKVPEPAERWIKEHEKGRPFDVHKLDAYIEADQQLRIARDEHGKPIDVDPIEAVVSLACFAAATEPLSPWEKLPCTRRSRRSARIAKKARELAELLEDPGGPKWPSAIELLSRSYPPATLLADPSVPKWPFQPIRSLTPAAFLLSLAVHAERTGRRPARDARPKTGTPAARIFARELSIWFDHRYGRVPNEIVADIVNMQMALDPPADADAVREWRGAK